MLTGHVYRATINLQKKQNVFVHVDWQQFFMLVIDKIPLHKIFKLVAYMRVIGSAPPSNFYFTYVTYNSVIWNVECEEFI